MNSRFATSFLIALVVSLSLALGASLSFIVQIYDVSEKDVFLTVGTYKRIVLIENIDLERGVVGARTIDKDISRARKFVFTIDNQTLFQKEEPIIEDGVIIGYTETENISPTEIQVGDEAFVRLDNLEDGRLYSSAMLIGRPFTRP